MEGGSAHSRPQYQSRTELMLTLVGYAVGLGNVWRFPYLVFTYGGGAFLVPYFVCLLLLGLPLFVLEMGLGQIMQQGTLGIWESMRLPRLKGIGVAATIGAFLVSLYYNVILAWTIYYLGRTLLAIPSGILPWSDQAAGYTCPETVLYPNISVFGAADLIVADTGVFNPKYAADFWCPEVGIPTAAEARNVPSGYALRTTTPRSCPARAAAEFWKDQALMQSSGMDDLGGFHLGLLLSFAIAWILVYLCVRHGIQSSGKVVYVTALLPYAILALFLVRALTLPNAAAGLWFYLSPDFSKLLTTEVWIRAATQIFYSLGVGFGSLVAFASYGSRTSDFVGDSTKVALINCGTSFFAGFVVFPILGYLAEELSTVNPCIQSNDLTDLSSIGLSGTGLAFIAFPIAIAQMTGSFVWAILFFLMLFCLGIDSQFAMVESVMTVITDAKLFPSLTKPALASLVCFGSFLAGLVFVTRGGIYWFTFFDYYSCVAVLFFVCLMECVGLMWFDEAAWPRFQAAVREATGWEFGTYWEMLFRYLNPAVLLILFIMAFSTFDLMGAATSVRYPEGSGYLPTWSIYAGWFMGLSPIAAFALVFLLHRPPAGKTAALAYGATDTTLGA